MFFKYLFSKNLPNCLKRIFLGKGSEQVHFIKSCRSNSIPPPSPYWCLRYQEWNLGQLGKPAVLPLDYNGFCWLGGGGGKELSLTQTCRRLGAKIRNKGGAGVENK